VAQSWFKRFQFENFDIEDAPRSVDQSEKDDEIMEKAKARPAH